MSFVTSSPPDGTPTWIDLGVPDLDRAKAFYRALFGWEFDTVGGAEAMHYTFCLHKGRTAAALAVNPDPNAGDFWWTMYFATADCDATATRITDAGGTLVYPPMDILDQGRMALATDPVGAQFGLWQAATHVGCEIVNEPGALVRNDLVTATPEPARTFYQAVFDYTLDGNPDIPEYDFTFLRRRDGKEIGGILGDRSASTSRWATVFEVAGTDAVARAATAAGGTATTPEDAVYGRSSTITDPFGTEFSVIQRPPDQQA